MLDIYKNLNMLGIPPLKAKWFYSYLCIYNYTLYKILHGQCFSLQIFLLRDLIIANELCNRQCNSLSPTLFPCQSVPQFLFVKILRGILIWRLIHESRMRVTSTIARKMLAYNI